VGVGGRGGYFDGFGIIRDVMQNHLLQILALLSMERPVRFDAQAVRDEKVRLLRCVAPAALEDVVIGQYAAGEGGTHPAYRQENGVPPDSLATTYAAALLRIHNERWDGVPFFLESGKAMDERVNEVRIRFRPVPVNIFGASIGTLKANELILRIQPGEAIELKIMNKVPGLTMALQRIDLDLQYKSTFDVQIPDAYECLLLDVIEGDRSLFIRADELEAAWDVFSPVLGMLEQQRIQPVPYRFGAARPGQAVALARQHGIDD
jgi:glucose-6-phosphate 1-dehydrogenase